MASLFADPRREGAQPHVVGNEHVGALLRGPGTHANQSPDRLSEKEIGHRVGRVDADGEPRDIDSLGDHAHRDDPGIIAFGERGDLLRRLGVVRRRNGRAYAEAIAKQSRDGLCVFLIEGDHHAGRARIAASQMLDLPMCLREDRRQPLAPRIEGSA